MEFTGLDRLCAPWLGGRGAIFVLHRAAPAGTPLLDPDHTTSADLLDDVLGLTKAAGFDCVSLDELPDRLRSARGARFAAFTFDDGYRDNVATALPVFTAHQVPLCIYAITGALDRSLEYWWGALARVVESHGHLDLRPLGLPETVASSSWSEKQATYARLERWVHEDLERRAVAVSAWCSTHYGIDAATLLDEDALTWDDLRALGNDPLVTIGAHSQTHRRLATLDESQLRHEVAGGRERLERELGRSVHHFAYPYGGPAACGAREFRATADAGYRTAVTTRRGNVFAEHAGHLTALPRRRLTEGQPDPRTAHRALSGTEWFVRRGPRVVRS